MENQSRPVGRAARWAARGCAVGLAFLALAGNGRSPPLAPLRWPDQLAAGDVIFRRGVGTASELVRAGAGGTYSHVGVIVLRGGEPWVVHAVPAESPGEADVTKAEPLGRFLDARRATAYAVYRLDPGQVAGAMDRAAQAASASEAMARRHVPFGFVPPPGGGEVAYCTQIVLRAYALAGVDLGVSASGPRLPFLRVALVSPADLRRSPRLRWVAEASAAMPR